MRMSGPTTPPRRRRCVAGGGPYVGGAVKSTIPTGLACEQDDPQPDEDQRPHRAPLDPAEDAGIRCQQQHAQDDQYDACRPRMASVMAMPLDVTLRRPPWVWLDARCAGRG